MKAGKKLIVCMLCVCAMVTGLLTGCGKKPMTDAEYAEIAKSTAADNAKKVVMTIEKNGKVIFFFFFFIDQLRRLSYLSLLFFEILHSYGYTLPFFLCL